MGKSKVSAKSKVVNTTSEVVDEPVAPYKRSNPQRQLDRIEMVKLMRRGWTQVQIAEKMGLSVTTITHDWKVVIREVAETRNKCVEELVAMKLEEYAEIKREAWKQWEESKKDYQRRVLETYTKADGTMTMKESETLQGQCGDSSYLSIILQCVNAERELLGINPVKEIKGSMTTTLNWDVLLRGLPPGPVPDVIEAEIEKVVREGIGYTPTQTVQIIP